MDTQDERREKILGIVEEFALYLAKEEAIRQAISVWEPGISAMALRFEEVLRENIPIGKPTVIHIHPSPTGTFSVLDPEPA